MFSPFVLAGKADRGVVLAAAEVCGNDVLIWAHEALTADEDFLAEVPWLFTPRSFLSP